MKKTLLLTDIVNSTAITQQIGDERMSKIWIKHDETARSLLQQYKAVEADRTDGFLMLFDSVDEACLYAIQLHMGFEELSEKENIDFKTRIGIHTGDVILIETSEEHRAAGVKHIEVEGIAKPTAARVMSIAGGGQTLLSNEAFDELDKDTVKYTSHGHWRMKGVAEPLELFETGNEDTLLHPPQDSEKVYRVNLVDEVWQPVRETIHNLSKERDQFIGRKEDLHQLAELINAPTTQLLTILGPGGTGKTRISKRYARMWLGDYPGGVWFCDLAESRTLEGIVSAVASALDIQLEGGESVTQIGNAIMGREECLVILDNFEQITLFAEASLGHWLKRAPKARFIVTSRNLLHLPGEKTMELKPLPINKDGLDLFEARAAERKSSFKITPENRDDVISIVNTLEGMPLAIELAAARIAVLRPKQIKERLKDRFKLLRGAKGVTERQQTLRGAIDWSWDLLEEWEQSALAQCSIFEGGFTLEAAEEVIDLSLFPDAPMVMDVVQSLVNKSLIRSEVNRYDIDESWFGMYISIREYTSEKLKNENTFKGAGSGLKLNCQKQHAVYYAQFGTDEMVDGYQIEANRVMFNGLKEELDNFWAALQFSLQQEDDINASLLITAVWQIIERTGLFHLIRKPLRRLLQMEAASDISKAKGYAILSAYAANLSDKELILESLDKGLEIAKRSKQKRYRASILLGAAYYYTSRWNNSRAEELINECKALIDKEESILFYVRVLYISNGIAVSKLKLKEAEQGFLECLELCKKHGIWGFEIFIQEVLANLKKNKGETGEAMKMYLEALEKAEKATLKMPQIHLLIDMGYLYEDLGKQDKAIECFNRSIKISRDTGVRGKEAFLLLALARSLYREKVFEEAHENIDKSMNIYKELNDLAGQGMALIYRGFAFNIANDHNAAFDTLSKALEIGKKTKADMIIIEANRALGIAAAGLGNYDQAEKYCHETESLLQDKNNIFVFEFYTEWAKVAFLAGNEILAKEKIEKAAKLKVELKVHPKSYPYKLFNEVEELMNV